MAERPPVPAHLVPFWLAARPDLDPHRRWRFELIRPLRSPPPRRMAAWLMARLDGTIGTLEAVHALLDYALGPGDPGEEICEFWPGYFADSPGHGIVAVGNPSAGPLSAILRFRPAPEGPPDETGPAARRAIPPR